MNDTNVYMLSSIDDNNENNNTVSLKCNRR